MTSKNSISELQSLQAGRLQRLGILLFLLGLITGFLIPMMANPRMGLSSHLEGVMNGIFVLLLGILWSRLRLSKRGLQWAFGLAVYGTFANWAVTLLSGFWGAGGAMMPFAAGGFEGTSIQEMMVSFMLISLSLAMIALCVILLFGLRPKKEIAPSGDFSEEGQPAIP